MKIELKGKLDTVEKAMKLVDKIQNSKSEVITICPKQITSMSREYTDTLISGMTGGRSYKAVFLKGMPERFKTIFMEAYRDFRYGLTEDIIPLREKIEVIVHDGRPPELKGIKKNYSHKNDGDYTSTDYYDVDGITYIFVRARDKDAPNHWWSLETKNVSEMLAIDFGVEEEFFENIMRKK